MRLLFDTTVRVSGEPSRYAANKMWRVRAICGRPLCRLTYRIHLPFIRATGRACWTGFADMDLIPILPDLLASRPAVFGFIDRLEPRIRDAREELRR